MSHSLLSLLQLCDPALPIGGYAHSGGLETYVQAGVVRDPVTAREFVREMLSTNLHYTDAALMALAHGATMEKDPQRILQLDLLCEAVKIPWEIRQASTKLGGRLLKLFRGIAIGGLSESPLDLSSLPFPGHAPSQTFTPLSLPIRHYPVVFGCCAATLGIGLQETLAGFYYNAAAGMVTNCVKLIPIGQQDGQELLFSLQSLIAELVARNSTPDKDRIGVSSPGLDIRCMQHEQLYSRLYMS